MAFKYHVVEGKNPKTGAAIFFAMADPVDTVKLPEICEEVSHACTACSPFTLSPCTHFPICTVEFVFLLTDCRKWRRG